VAQARLLEAGARLCHRVYLHPQPVIAGCTGHALALGALLLASCDLRVGAEGPYKLGTNEVAIGMALPRFGVEIARDRLSKRHFQVAVQHARVYDPAGAVEAGWLDELVAPDAVEATAVAHATDLAATLHPGAFARTRTNTRGAVGEAILEGLDLDLAEMA
jgi:enoyl-CoA hydratase